MHPVAGNARLTAIVAVIVLPSMYLAGWNVHPVGLDGFLLVETVSELHTGLVEGNYSGGTICFDFPTYDVDLAAHKVHEYLQKPPREYRAAYGSGFFAGGLVSSGGASGLRFIDKLPFKTTESLSDGNGTFSVNVTIDANLDVILEGKPFEAPYKLAPGKAWTLSYDVLRDFQNPGDGCCNGSFCKIENVGHATITNHGVWKKSDVVFGQ